MVNIFFKELSFRIVYADFNVSPPFFCVLVSIPKSFGEFERRLQKQKYYNALVSFK